MNSLALLFAFIAVVHCCTNQATNPGFETSGLSGWTQYSSNTVAVTSQTSFKHGGTTATQSTLSVSTGVSAVYQVITLAQTNPESFVIGGWSKATSVSGAIDGNYAIYADVFYTDSTALYGQVAKFNIGTHDWEYSSFQVNPAKAVQTVWVYAMFRSHTGTVYFDDVELTPVTCGQHIAVASYFSNWATVIAAAPKANILILNPASGPGTYPPSSSYLTQISNARAAGMRVIGYVWTNYAAVGYTTVTGQIDNHYSWYNVDGIFLDSSTSTCGTTELKYFLDLYNYIKAKPNNAVTVTTALPANLVITNQGAQPACTDYMSRADIIVNFEGYASTYTSSYSAPAWVSGYPAYRFWHIVHDTTDTAAAATSIVNLSKTRNAGYIYAVPTTNYNSLPDSTFWNAEVAAV